MNFKELDVIEPILKALNEAGYENPTPIQEQAIPAILEGRDMLGCAQTGTGKTGAFAIPLLQNTFNNKKNTKGVKPIKALILAPTRELAIQIEENCRLYSKYIGLRNKVIFGGVSQHPQVRALKTGVDVLIATPGRLLDLVNQKFINLSSVEYFVLDEADRMLDMGMFQDVKKIIALLPKERQNLLFSATMPKEVENLVSSILKNPVKIEIAPVSSTVDTIEQGIYLVDRKNKRSLLVRLLRDDAIKSVLVFSRTKRGADMIKKDLNKAGIEAEAIHGDKSQNARQRALNDFKRGKVKVLVATDIAARGIDVDELSHVINFDLPEEPETYVHRIGRTGRAGNTGTAISFCDEETRNLLRYIEKLIGKKVPVIEDYSTVIVESVERKENKKPARSYSNKRYGRANNNNSRTNRNNNGTKKKVSNS